MQIQQPRDVIRALTEAGLTRRRQPIKLTKLEGCYLDLSPLKLDLGRFVPFLLPSESGGTFRMNTALEEVMEFSLKNSETEPCVFVTSSKVPPLEPLRSQLQDHSIAVIDADAMQSLSAAADSDGLIQALAIALSQWLGAQTLSPYKQGKPAHAGRFFGRSDKLNEINPGKRILNCTILGNRRIGKTSLMHEVRDRLKRNFAERETIWFADLYASKCDSTLDAISLILPKLDIRVPIHKSDRVLRMFTKKFPELIQRKADVSNTSIVLLIDEFDKMLEIDSKNGYEFLHLLREMAMHERCHVIIAGFRRLMEVRTRQESPYFNFTREVMLGRLSREETNEMVSIPLGRLGIRIAGENLPTVIYRETRGHPELIQMYCDAVVRLTEKNRRPPNEGQLINHVANDLAFNRAILHTFLANTNAVEQFVCLLLFDHAKRNGGIVNYEFGRDTIEEIRPDWLDLGMNHMTAILLNLMVGSLIEQIRGTQKYRFAVPQLARYVENQDLPSSLASAEQEARKHGPQIIPLISAEPDGLARGMLVGEPA